MKHPITLTVNGQTHELLVRSNETLLETLREKLKLTGAREGCGVSVCGACTVLMDGDPVSSCIQLSCLANGHEIQTIEGVAPPGGPLHPLQEAFWQKGAMQCSYCTPGFVLASKSILEAEPDISEEKLHHLLAGNLCRCTGYAKIKDALLAAQAEMKSR